VCRRPNQDKSIHSLSNRESLWDDDESRTCRSPDELAKVFWHRRVVVCHEYAADAAGDRQHLRILEASEASCSRGSEVDFGIAAKDGADDDLVESASA
jgi:hypothetical protein